MIIRKLYLAILIFLGITLLFNSDILKGNSSSTRQEYRFSDILDRNNIIKYNKKCLKICNQFKHYSKYSIIYVTSNTGRKVNIKYVTLNQYNLLILHRHAYYSKNIVKNIVYLNHKNVDDYVKCVRDRYYLYQLYSIISSFERFVLLSNLKAKILDIRSNVFKHVLVDKQSFAKSRIQLIR